MARDSTSTGHKMPTSAAEVRSHHGNTVSSNNLRAAVFGINDGLVSNTSLIMGIAGATMSVDTILIGGVAGLLSGAFSMAAGEYVSVRSQRQLNEKLIRREREEIARYPKQETEEIALIYNERGLPLPEARRVARTLMRDPENAVEVHAREELGLDPENLGSAYGAAFSSFAAFAVGGLVPLVPFILRLSETHAVGWSAVLAAAALFTVGVAVNRLTGQRALPGGLRMLLIGGGAGVITYVIGKLLGVGLS